MADNRTHQTLAVHNFTAFREAYLEFVPGINVFVGENGTGKTHLLKALYAFQLQAARKEEDIRSILTSLYQTTQMNELIRHGAEPPVAGLDGLFGDVNWAMALHPNDTAYLEFSVRVSRPVFIPAMDMMGHTRGFVEAYEEIRLDFDRTCRDIVGLLALERRNGSDSSALQTSLTALLGGEIERDDSGRFHLVTPRGRLAMPLVAEGLRKIATLVRLVQNGWIAPGTTLFWDEPEVNLNPILMDEVVGAILTLARSGVQVFLATHSYVILKELDLQAKPADSVRFFAFQPNEDGTTVNVADDIALLDPNPILEQYNSLYDRELTRATGRNRHGERVR